MRRTITRAEARRMALEAMARWDRLLAEDRDREVAGLRRLESDDIPDPDEPR